MRNTQNSSFLSHVSSAYPFHPPTVWLVPVLSFRLASRERDIDSVSIAPNIALPARSLCRIFFNMRRLANATGQPADLSGVEGVTFPSLPDCPLCSTPTMEDELSQFGMCSQCKVERFLRGSRWIKVNFRN